MPLPPRVPGGRMRRRIRNDVRKGFGPTDIAVTWGASYAGGNIPHGTAGGTTIGTIGGTGGTAPLTFSEVTDASGTFTISGTNLNLTSAVSYDGAGDDARAITIRATDAAAATYDETITAYVLADDGAVDPGTYDSGTLVLSNGGKTVTKGSGSSSKGAIHNANLSGKKQFEFSITAAATTMAVGIATSNVPTSGFPDGGTGNSVLYRADGTIWKDGVQAASGYPTWTAGDVVIGAYDAATDKVWFGKNGMFQGSPTAGTGQATTATNATYRLAVFLSDAADSVTIRDTAAELGTALESGFNAVATPSNIGVTKLRKTGTQALSAGSVWYALTWDVEDHDNLGAVNLASSSTDIVVPDGVALMRAWFRTAFANTILPHRVRLEGTSRTFMGDIRFDAPNEGALTASSGWVSVTAGDTLQLVVNSGVVGDTIGNSTFGYPELTIEWAAAFSQLHA